MRYNAAELFRLFLYPYIIKFNCVEFGSGNARRPALRAEQLVTRFLLLNLNVMKTTTTSAAPLPAGLFHLPFCPFRRGHGRLHLFQNNRHAFTRRATLRPGGPRQTGGPPAVLSGQCHPRKDECAFRKPFAQRKIDVSSGDEFSGKLAFTHKIYERFLDMKAVQRGRRTIRQNRKIHNRFIEYTLANIEYKLLYGFTDEVAQRIKAQFNEQNPQ